jgi:hypothetical protein
VGVATDDPLADVQSRIILLESLRRVERLVMSKGPLALAAAAFVMLFWHFTVLLLAYCGHGGSRGWNPASCVALRN